MIKYIEVIDDDLDVSFADSLALLETVWNGEVGRDKLFSYMFENTKLFGYNFSKLELVSRELSKKLKLPKNAGKLKIMSDDLEFHTPTYSPPPSKQLYAFELYCTHQSSDYRYKNTTRSPQMPTVPTAKTNTNLANYVHRLYMYRQYVKDQIKAFEYKQTQLVKRAKSEVNLKHKYNAKLSKTMARKLSAKSGRRIAV
jgi:hypothetical protein